MPWALIIPAVVSLAAAWYSNDQASKRQKEAQEAAKAGQATADMHTQAIDKWTPEQQQLFKGLMHATLKRGFDPGGGMPGGQFRSPTVVNRAFQPTGNVPTLGG